MAPKSQAARRHNASTADAMPGGVGPGTGGVDPGLGGGGPELEALRERVLDATYADLRMIKWDVEVPDRVRVSSNGQTRIPLGALRDACLRRVEHAKGCLDLSSWGQGARGGGVGPQPAEALTPQPTHTISGSTLLTTPRPAGCFRIIVWRG